MRSLSPDLRWVIGALVAAVVGVGLLVSPPHAAADDDEAYRQVVDITFPVAGETSYIRDYHHCRGVDCSRRHKATDIMAPEGRHIHAAMGGTITWITGLDGNPPSYGYMISIAGDDGRTYNYIHLGRQEGSPSDAYVSGLERGTRVERGQHIGFNGCSGNASCDLPHLHFEIEDPTITDPYGTHRMDPYDSLRAAEARGDIPGADLGPFVDVSMSHPFLAEIEWGVDAGLVQGYADGTFRPTGDFTRQAMAAWLYRHAGSPEGPFETPGFPDVAESHPFYTEIMWSASVGITDGYPDGTFRPTDLVTRQAAAAFLFRASGAEPHPTKETGFSDVDPTHDFASEIAWLVSEGITHGYDDGTYRPTAPVTRQAALAFLHRF